jgi:protein-disulfide isomerase
MNTKRIFMWLSFVVIIGLIIWGLIAAEMKSSQKNASIPLPDQIVTTDHIRGDETAKVTLVEYSDFQCPSCRSYHPFVERLLAETSSSTLRFVYRHFPLSQHANAVPAAKASEAAGKQGKFWEMYNILFDKQANWEASTDARTIFTGYARELNLDIPRFEADMNSKEIDDIINKDLKSGLKANIKGTPTFFINGTQIDNPKNYDEFKKVIDEAAK